MTERDLVLYLLGFFEMHGIPDISFSHEQMTRFRTRIAGVRKKERTELILQIEEALGDPQAVYNITREYFEANCAPKRTSIAAGWSSIMTGLGQVTRGMTR